MMVTLTFLTLLTSPMFTVHNDKDRRHNNEGSLPYYQVEAVAGLDFVVGVGTPGYPWHN